MSEKNKVDFKEQANLNNPGPPEDQTNIKSDNAPPPPESDPSPFQILWGEYVHRIKVHELLRCLEIEQKKLQVLRDNLDLNKDTNDEENNEQTEREAKVPYQKVLQEEEEAAEEIAEDIRKNKDEPDYVSRSVIRLFDNNRTITDEQFERILELCKDEQERKHLREAYQEKKSREKYLHNATEDRRMLYNFLNSNPMQMFMLCVIFLSTIVLFLLSFETINNFYSFGLVVLDSMIMSVFIVEAGLKIYIYKDDYFKSPANCLDLIIIITHFVEIFVDLVTQCLAMSSDISAYVWFKLLKSLRSLRVLRAIKFLPNLQIIITTIIQSLMSISSITALMLLFMFVFAVGGRELFREGDEKRFGDFLKTMLTLFQLLTLDDWGDILEDNGYDLVMFFYLFLYIVAEYFVFLNLFVAVLVDNFQLSIEAANVFVDTTAEEKKWKERIRELDKQSSLTSLKSKHKNPVHELGIEDYMRVNKDSREANLLADNLKKLAAIDFQYFMWNRRMRLTSIVLEAATQEKGYTMNVGQRDTEIAPVDVIESKIANPDDMPLKPKKVPKKLDDMGESNFELHSKDKNHQRNSLKKK